MAVDPFEDDPFADPEIVPSQWRRESRAARRSLRRVQQAQARRQQFGPLENLGELAATESGGQAVRDGGGFGGGQNDVVQALRELVDHAQAIRQLLEEIKSGLPFVGAYGP